MGEAMTDTKAKGRGIKAWAVMSKGKIKPFYHPKGFLPVFIQKPVRTISRLKNRVRLLDIDYDRLVLILITETRK